MNELISIVLPVYNGEKYLKESIDSILAQTYTNWELLILDDCSIDSSPDIALEYARADERIRYFRNENNLRLPRNLNRGFSLAKGDYLTWTSDDNRYKPTALEKMHSVLVENDGVEFVFASCRIIDEQGKPIEYIMVTPGQERNVIGLNCVGACFMYTRKAYEVVGEYDPELTLVEDWDYWQRICARFHSRGIAEILYEYRWHAGALTSTMKKDQFYSTMEKMMLKNMPMFGKTSLLQKYLCYQTLDKCRIELKTQENPYHIKFMAYKLGYLFRYRVPGKIRRLMIK